MTKVLLGRGWPERAGAFCLESDVDDTFPCDSSIPVVRVSQREKINTNTLQIVNTCLVHHMYINIVHYSPEKWLVW